MSRDLKFSQAIHEATDLCLAADPSVYLMGLGVPDPKGVFGTTLGLKEKYGERVLDMPTAENGMTGVALGSALCGMRPIMVHQRLDFALLAVEQLVNQAAKWHYMFGGQRSVPMVIRLIVGRGWGQGPQHSQSLHSWFAHIPGLKVVAPATPHDAKGMMIASVEDNNPVLFIEHRWLHNISGPVPEGHYRVPLGRSRVVREGEHITLVGTSYMTIEALRAARVLADHGISAEVVDLRTLNPLDDRPIVESVRKTGRLVVADTSWANAGISAEVVSRVSEKALMDLRAAPRRITLPTCPSPTSAGLARHFYPRAQDIVAAALEVLDMAGEEKAREEMATALDVPDTSFAGPF